MPDQTGRLTPDYRDVPIVDDAEPDDANIDHRAPLEDLEDPEAAR